MKNQQEWTQFRLLPIAEHLEKLVGIESLLPYKISPERLSKFSPMLPHAEESLQEIDKKTRLSLYGEKSDHAFITYFNGKSKLGDLMEITYSSDVNQTIAITWGNLENFGVLEFRDSRRSSALERLSNCSKIKEEKIRHLIVPKPIYGVHIFEEKDISNLKYVLDELL